MEPDEAAPLAHTAQVADLVAVRRLLAAAAQGTAAGRAALVSAADAQGRTALHRALCLPLPAERERRSSKLGGREPIPQQRGAVVRALLAAGADWRAADMEGRTPLVLAARGGCGAAAAALLAAAAASGDHSYVDAVAAGADTSALAEASAAGQESVVALLLAAGADPGVVLPSGETPLHRAVGRPDVAARLLDALAARRSKPAAAGSGTGSGSGFRHAALDRPRAADGAAAAHVAAAAGDGGMLRLLARAGADLHARAQAGATPLLVAAASGQPDALHALLECLHARAGQARAGADRRCSGACSRPPAAQGRGGGGDGRGAGRAPAAGSELGRALAARDETTGWSVLGWALARADAGALAALLRACQTAGHAPLRLLQDDDQPVLAAAVQPGRAPRGKAAAGLCSHWGDAQPRCTADVVAALEPLAACCKVAGISWQAAHAGSRPSSKDSVCAGAAAAPAPAQMRPWGPGAAGASAAGAAPWAAVAATPAAAAVLVGGWRALGALAAAGVRPGALCALGGPGAPALLELAAGLGRTRCLKLLLDAGALLLGRHSTWSCHHGIVLGAGGGQFPNQREWPCK
jgi:ankyrin repeat protein